jgi:6-phosphofructokinase 1
VCLPRCQIDKCFGFDTAVEMAQEALLAAKVEARSASNGIGLVKLMGRQSGYIAMQAAMASGELVACLPLSAHCMCQHF